MKDESKTLVESNVLLEARHSFNLVELKMLLMAISKIKRADEAFKAYRVYTSEFRDMAAVKGHHAYYKYLRQTARSLRRKEIEIPTEQGHLITGYFSDIELFKNHGYMDFYISPKMIPYLLQLKREFTIYDIRNVINCKSVHSIRIYQLLKQYEKIGCRVILLKDLKNMIGLDGQYIRWSNFKIRILDVAKRELKKCSDIFFEYETTREGRLIDKITFTIKKQKQRRLFDGKLEPSLNDAKPLTNYQVDVTDKAIDEQNRLLDAEVVPLSQSGLKR